MATYKPLSTDFKDDILASQNSKRKYTQVNNSDGTVSFQDSTAYSQVGSSYGAKEVNEEREAINNIYANKLVTLDEIDLVTEAGFFTDALAVKELNTKIKNVGTVKNLAAHGSANLVATGVINLADYKYFILQCCDAAGTRVLASVNIFKDQIKYGSAYEHQVVFAGEVSNYQATCYFGTDGKIYTKGKTQYCSVRLYGVIA